MSCGSTSNITLCAPATRRVAFMSMRAQKTHLFFLTFPNCSLSKAYLALVIDPISVSAVIGQEKHRSGVPHFHVFLETIEPFTFEELLSCLREFEEIKECALNVQAVRNRRDVIRYCSKEDPLVFTKNIPSSQLSFFAQCSRFAESSTEYSTCHSFVAFHANRYRFIERFHQDHKKLAGIRR